MLTSASSSPAACSGSSTFRSHSCRSPRAFGTSSRTQLPPNELTSNSPSTPSVALATSDVATQATSNHQQPRTVDVGTQYSPPDWPPTDPRSSLHQYTTHLTSSAITQPDPLRIDPKHYSVEPYSSADEQPTTATKSIPEPAEPQLRITPQTSLQNASRRLQPDGELSGTASASSSASKRIRQGRTDTKLKTMPDDYATCDPKILAGIIAEMLMRLIHHNDEIPLKDGQLTRFHSRAPPGISVHDYLARLTFHATLSPPILLSMVFFIDRLSANFPTFIINSLTVHRFLITAATVASKGLSDSFWTNQTYARVGGVSIKELALLELELLIKTDWKIVPKPEFLVDYYRGLVEQSEEWILEGPTSQRNQINDETGALAATEISSNIDTLEPGTHAEAQSEPMDTTELTA